MQEKDFNKLIEDLLENRRLELNLNNQNIDEREAKKILIALDKNNSISKVSWVGTKIALELKKMIDTAIQRRNFLSGISMPILNCYRAEAEMGDINKQFNLGWMYNKGVGVPVDIVEAIKWYTLAAVQEHPMAMYNLAILHIGVYEEITADKNVGASWAIKAALLPGIPEASVLLGYLYETGTGVAQNFQHALKLYHRAADEGCAEAYYQLYLCYKDGRKEVLEKNFEIANEWLNKAQAQNHIEAQYEWGLMLETSKPEEAEHYFELAAAQNNVFAQIKLGKCIVQQAVYSHSGSSRPPPSDLQKKLMSNVLDWLKQAALQGNPMAQYTLANYWLNPSPLVHFYEYDLIRERQDEGLQWLMKAYDQGYRESLYACNLMYVRFSLISMNVPPTLEIIYNMHRMIQTRNILVKHNNKLWYYYKGGPAPYPEPQPRLMEEIDLNNCPSRALYDTLPFNDDGNVTIYNMHVVGLVIDESSIAKLMSRVTPLQMEKRYSEGHKRMLLNQREIPPLPLTLVTLPLLRPQEKLLESVVRKISKSAEIENMIQTNAVLPGNISLSLAKYRQDAENGDITKQYLLGWMYDKGSEVSQDYREAIRWYTKAASKGHQISQYNLACIYQSMYADNKSHTIYWAKKAIELPGIPEAYLLLAYLNEIEGGEPTLKTAAQQYQRAAEMESEEACIQLSRCYRDGVGVEKSIKEAMRWLKKPVEQENTKALFEMGCLYDYVKKEKEAFKCYMKAAEGGDANALYRVGRRYYDEGRCYYDEYDDAAISKYHDGEGGDMKMTADHKKAFGFIVTAAQRGSAEAQYFLDIKNRVKYNTTTEINEEFEPKALTCLSNLSTLPITEPEATIYVAAKHNQVEIFQTWIRFPGLDISKLNSKALVITLESGFVNFAHQLLLVEDIDVNIVGDKGMTPLELVIQASNLNIFKLIINKKSFNANLHLPLLKTVLDEEESMVKLLLAIPHLDVNATETPGSESALWLGSKHGNTSIVKLLLTHQDINVDYRSNVLSADEKDKSGKKKLTAQEIANVYGHEAVVTVIQDYKDVKFLREQAVGRRQKIRDEFGSANNNLIQETGNQEENLSSRMKQYEEEIEQLKAQRKQFETQMLQQQTENQQMARQMNEMFMLFKASFGQPPKNSTTETPRIEMVSDSNSVAPVTARISGADVLK